uniref:Uncharacterized protein LOC104231631 n=1 Tax=Nicotiana sylvestris TaxID=4096 RepID=A0A1U7WWH8_NICSY|nr:PREDICTED: uncharacterized protein LOC104231631 [Nicotiana sylvestris]
MEVLEVAYHLGNGDDVIGFLEPNSFLMEVLEVGHYHGTGGDVIGSLEPNFPLMEVLDGREIMSEYGDDAETEMGENPFADIEEYIEDTNAIVPPAIGAATFKVEHGLILMLKAEGFFRNSTDDDPTQHLRNFLGVCAMHKHNNVSDDALRLRCFKYSLAGDARKWLQNLPPNFIHSWPELIWVFLSKWFLQSNKSELRDKIFFFKQIQGEKLHEAWDRFKLYLVRSPNHGFPDSMLLENFYMGLDPMNQAIAKNAANRSFMDKSFARVTQILDKMAKHNQAWHSEDTTGGISYGSPSLSNLIKENQERDQVIVGLATNINVLTKMFIENQTKKVNAVENVQPILDENFEEANYINNPQGGYQRQHYHGQGQQSQWRPNPQGQGNQQWRNDQGNSHQGNWNNNNNFANRSSNPYVPPKGHYANQGSLSESKLESMLERVLQNQEKSDASMRNMTEVVGSHTVSIQKLEMQMRDLSREQNPKQKWKLPSDTIANPKSGGSGSTSHVMAITTRSGKVLQGDIEQEVVGEESKQEVEAEEQGVVEVERVPEKEKVQEVNQEGVKEKEKETSKSPPPIPRPPPPFPQRLIRRVNDIKLKKFYDILKQLSANIPFLEAFQEMPGFAKYLKDLITKNRTTKNEVVKLTHRVSSIIATSPVQKKEDPGAFTILCTIGERDFAKALCDNGASINLMPLAMYKKAGLGMPRPTIMRLQMADRSIKRPVGIVDDVIVKVGKFHLPIDFVILDCVVDKEIPIILGRPFLTRGRALMDSE